MDNKRYIYDALYGRIHFPEFIWDVLVSPEVQRLREIRLCNINSLCLTGGANINRFEHVVGTCYLALKNSETWTLKRTVYKSDVKIFLLSALLHDIANAAFGHSIEYIEERKGYNPENAFENIVFGERGTSIGYTYKNASLQPIFFGLRGNLYEIFNKKVGLSDADINQIALTVNGQGFFGPIIKNSMDLDNIDNVCRMAYHIGIFSNKNLPIDLALSLTIDDEGLRINNSGLHLVKEWWEVRRKLYLYLLLNPEEFSGKCMLTEAIENSQEEQYHGFSWSDTDYRLLEKLKRTSNENDEIISRLMTGNLYGCLAIFSTTKIEYSKNFMDRSYRKALEKEINKLIKSEFKSKFKSIEVGIHSILDVNKTERNVTIKSLDNTMHSIGKSSKQLLIGIFAKNKDLNMTDIQAMSQSSRSKIKQLILKYLSTELVDNDINEIPLYGDWK